MIADAQQDAPSVLATDARIDAPMGDTTNIDVTVNGPGYPGTVLTLAAAAYFSPTSGTTQAYATGTVSGQGNVQMGFMFPAQSPGTYLWGMGGPPAMFTFEITGVSAQVHLNTGTLTGGSATIDLYGPTGGTIEGSLSAMDATASVTSSFAIRRTADVP